MKIKHPKAPRKPKKGASVQVKENYLAKYADWKKKCADVDKVNKRSEELDKKIHGTSTLKGITTVRRIRKTSTTAKKKTGAKKSTARKATSRKRR